MSLTVTSARQTLGPRNFAPGDGAARGAQSGAHSTDAAPVSAGRALVPVEPARPHANPLAERSLSRPDAAFIAQLIATADHAPQTRARCRAEPAAATACYHDSVRRLATARQATGAAWTS